MPKEVFIVTIRITLQAAILDCSETSIHSHSFLKLSPGNTGGRVFLLVKLQTDCSEWRLYTKMAPPRMFSCKSSALTVQKQLFTAIHFQKYFQKIPVVESFFWINYRLTVQCSDCVLKWLHKNVFLETFCLDCSEAAVHSHPFSKFSPGNTGGKVIL